MTLEPGRVYRVTVRGETNVLVIARSDGTVTTSEPLGGYWSHGADEITDARPLITLDLRDPADAVREIRAVADAARHICEWEVVDIIADQIEAQTKPPRIPEPDQIGALVKASQVGECDGSDRVWVRFSYGTDCWIDSLSHIRSWSDLADPELYPFGATS